MTRPIGVTVSALVIGLLGVAQIAAAGALLVLANKPNDGGWFPGLVTLVIHLLMLVLLAMAAWGLTTAVGLFRMLSWARYSVLTIAGCMLGFGALWGFWSFSNALRTHFQQVTLLSLAIGVASAMLGAGWLAYFCQRTTARWFTADYQNEFPEDGGFAPTTLSLTGTPAARREPPPPR